MTIIIVVFSFSRFEPRFEPAGAKVNLLELKWSRNDSQMIPIWSQNDSKMIPKWFQNDSKMIPKRSQNYPKMIPKWFQNDPKMIPKWSQNDPSMITKWSQNEHKMLVVIAMLLVIDMLLICPDQLRDLSSTPPSPWFRSRSKPIIFECFLTLFILFTLFNLLIF